MSSPVTDIPLQNYPQPVPVKDEKELQPSIALEKLTNIVLLYDKRQNFFRKMNCAFLTTFVLILSGSLILNETLAKESVASATNCIGIGILVSAGITLGIAAYMGIRGCLLGRKIIYIYHDLNPLARYKGKNNREDSFSTSPSAVELGQLEESKYCIKD
jgi:hypothetical protein